MTFTAIVSNPYSRALTFYTRGRELTVDITISFNGRARWSSLRGQVVQQAVAIRTLAPGASLSVDVPWTGTDDRGVRLEPGAYTVRAALLGDRGSIESNAVALRIMPR